MADFQPVQLTNGTETVVAENVYALVQYQYDGYWIVGEVEPPLTLRERFAFGPERPATPRAGVVYIQTPV